MKSRRTVAKKKPLLKRLHDYFLPHERNGHKPKVFRTRSVIGLAAGILALEAAYMGYVHVLVPKTNFLASVLPGTLTLLTNEDRAAQGLGRVSENPLLAQAATNAAKDMAARGYFSHDTPEGKKPWMWLDEVGYDYQYSGQNLAVNFTESKEVQEAWMNSPTHRANIVKPQYTEIGIGTAQGMYKGEEVTFVVQFFATPRTVTPAPLDTKLVVDTPKPAERLALTDLIPQQDATSQEGETAGVAEVSLEEIPSVVLGTTAVQAQELVQDAEVVAATAVTSPSYTLWYVFAGVITLAIILLLIGIVRHAQLPYFEVLGGALVIILIALAALYVNGQQEHSIEIPEMSAETAAG